MPATRQELFARLSDLGIETETHEHAAVFTVEEAQAHCGHLPGGHCKSLFLKDKKGGLWLIVTLDERPVNLKALARALDAKTFSFAKPELLMAVLGVIPGAVTPFGLINDTEQRVNLVLDAGMMGLELLNFHPLSNDATTAITPRGLRQVIAAFGHQARLFDFTAIA